MEEEPAQLVLSDIQMPNMDGHALCAVFGKPPMGKCNCGSVMHGDVKSAVGAMRNGAYDYLLKPIDIRELAIVTGRIGEFLALKQEHERLSMGFAPGSGTGDPGTETRTGGFAESICP